MSDVSLAKHASKREGVLSLFWNFFTSLQLLALYRVVDRHFLENAFQIGIMLHSYTGKYGVYDFSLCQHFFSDQHQFLSFILVLLLLNYYNYYCYYNRHSSFELFSHIFNLCLQFIRLFYPHIIIIYLTYFLKSGHSSSLHVPQFF